MTSRIVVLVHEDDAARQLRQEALDGVSDGV
jgi:hypothetical protein